MTLDLLKLYEAADPTKSLDIKKEEDRKYYINFSEVRGGKLIEELKKKITFFSRAKPTCQLFTGYIGCGKSTELLRLKAQLEKEGYHVVDFAVTDDLEMSDVDVGDILLVIARRIFESLEKLNKIQIDQPKGFEKLLKGAAQVLQTELEASVQASLPGIGQASISTEEGFSVEGTIPSIGELSISNKRGLSLVAPGIGKILIKAKNSPELRSKLREYLGPRTSNIIEVINEELLAPFQEQLKQQNKKGLVVIVDNLDRVESVEKPWGRVQPEYLFVDRGEQLSQLDCHVVYTIPLALMFSNELNRLTSRFGVDPKVLPMVPVKLPDGKKCDEGMTLLRQMVMARAFPDFKPQHRLGMIEVVFDTAETLDRLCLISGGHVRNLLILLNQLIVKDQKLPLSRQGLENVIKDRFNQMKLAVDNEEWDLLRRVHKSKEVTGDEGYQVLLRSMFVYEYRNREGSWFDVNPILAEAGRLKS